MKYIFTLFLLFALVSCKKFSFDLPGSSPDPEITEGASSYVKYSILKGDHYCDKSTIKVFTGDSMIFNVKFDSTAIYTTINAGNQGDINKLYGFTEGAENHVNSARIGWCWNKNALRLYAYAYTSSVRNFKEIAAVAIGSEVKCFITVSDKQYLFNVNGSEVSLPRALTTSQVSGFKQYPYFGGDEVAPHNTYIYIQDL